MDSERLHPGAVAFSFWEAGRLTYSELCGLHTEDADAVLYLIGAFKEEREEKAKQTAQQMRAREIAEEMARVSSEANAAEARKIFG